MLLMNKKNIFNFFLKKVTKISFSFVIIYRGVEEGSFLFIMGFNVNKSQTFSRKS